MTDDQAKQVSLRALRRSSPWWVKLVCHDLTAMQNLQAMYNINAESVLLDALTNALRYQKRPRIGS